jgi:hypothetical protein
MAVGKDALPTVLSTTNLFSPLSDWTVVDKITDSVPGQFQFTSIPTSNDSQRSHLVTSP